MQTVKEVAELLDVSNQTVYNHIEKNKFDLNNHLKKIAGIQHIDNIGIDIIRKSMGLISEGNEVQQLSLQETVSEISKVILKDYQNEIESNLELSNKQIENTISDQFDELKDIIKIQLNEKEKLEKIIEDKDNKMKELEMELKEYKEEIASLKEELIIEKNKGFFERVFKY